MDIVQQRIQDYLSGKEDLSIFYDWLANTHFLVHKNKDTKLRDLVFKIRLLHTKYRIGNITEDDLKLELRKLYFRG